MSHGCRLCGDQVGDVFFKVMFVFYLRSFLINYFAYLVALTFPMTKLAVIFNIFSFSEICYYKKNDVPDQKSLHILV